MAAEDTSNMKKKGNPSQAFSVRMDDGLLARLEKAAEIYRRNTGANESTSGLARTFIEIGLAQFERTGGLVVST